MVTANRWYLIFSSLISMLVIQAYVIFNGMQLPKSQYKATHTLFQNASRLNFAFIAFCTEPLTENGINIILTIFSIPLFKKSKVKSLGTRSKRMKMADKCRITNAKYSKNIFFKILII